MIKKLSLAFAPSGKESVVRDVIVNDLKDFYLDIKTDNLGNLIIHKKGRSKTIAITAPMDEVGFLITHTNENGIVNTSSIGRVKNNALHSILLKDEIGNLYINDYTSKFTDFNEKVLDYKLNVVNVCKANELNNDLTGKSLVFESNFRANELFYIGKALERSVCCKILCDLARLVRDSIFEYYFVFSAQNYCDKKGAQAALYNTKIDELYNICAVDTEINTINKAEPYLILRDKNFISTDFAEKITETFDFKKLVTDKPICEAGFWQKNHLINDVVAVGIPVGNLYTPNEIVNIDTIKKLTDILSEIVLP